MNRINQIVAGNDLQSPDDECIYALGDCAVLSADKNGQTVPPRAQAAHQQASYIARAIVRRLAGRPLTAPYLNRDYSSLVTLSRYSSVGSLMGSITGNVWIPGPIARLV